MTTRTSRPPRQRRTAGRFLAARSPRPDSLAAVSAHHSSSPLCTAKGRADPKGGPPHCHSAHLVFANGGAAAPASRLRAVASVGTDRVAAWDDDHSSAFRRARRSLSPGESRSLSSGGLRCRASSKPQVKRRGGDALASLGEQACRWGAHVAPGSEERWGPMARGASVRTRTALRRARVDDHCHEPSSQRGKVNDRDDR